MHAKAATIKIIPNSLHSPIPVAVDHISAITLCKQFGVELLADWPGKLVGSDPYEITLSSPILGLTLLLLAGLAGARVVCHFPAPYRLHMTRADSDPLTPDDPAAKIVLLVAHGSRNPLAATEHAQLCEKVQAQANAAQPDDKTRLRSHQIQVRPAYLELAEPSIAEAIDTAVAEGALRVRLLPHFLNSGNHVMRDLPEAVAEAEKKHPEVSIELAEHLGADAGLVSLLTTRVLAD